MTKEDQDHIIKCLETLVKLAGESTPNHRVLSMHTCYVLGALNLLFEKEGLEPVRKLFADKNEGDNI
jgi:hypothetical protein